VNETICPKPAAGWPVTVGLTRRQGEALRQAVASSNSSVTITVDTCGRDKLPALDYKSGTSMATPAAGESCSNHANKSLLKPAVDITALRKCADDMRHVTAICDFLLVS